MNALWALAKKDLLLLVRDKFALFWIFAFPLMFALFFGSVMGGGGSDSKGALTIAVVDQDQSDISRALAANLAKDKAVRLVRQGDAPESPDAPIETPSLEEARQLVQKGKRTAYLRVPKGFGDNPYAIFSGGGGGEVALEIGIDPGRSAEAGMLQGILMKSIMGSLRERFTNKDALQQDVAAAREEIASSSSLPAGQKLALTGLLGALDLFTQQFDLARLGGGESSATGDAEASPIKVVDVTRETGKKPRSAFDITFPQAIVWSLMSVAMGCAITLARERTTGTLTRLCMAPIGNTHLLGGKALGCFLACLAVMGILIAFGVFALGVRVGNWAYLGLALSCTAVCFTGLMMTMAVMGKTEAAVSGSAMGMMMPMAMLGGGMIPLIAMPKWLIQLSAISPFRWAISSVEGAAWREYAFSDMLLPCGILLAMGAAFFALGVLVFQRTQS